jgi:hypothetical protein
MKPQDRQQLLAWVAAGSVALLAATYLVFEPLARSWSARGAEIARLRKSAEDGTRLLERGDSLRARWESMRRHALTNQASLAENQLLKAFDRWTQDSRVGVSAIKPQLKRGDDDHATLECRVDAFGNLGALTRFLYNVEADPLALRLDVVEIAARDDRGEQLTLGLQVSGLILDPAPSR